MLGLALARKQLIAPARSSATIVPDSVVAAVPVVAITMPAAAPAVVAWLSVIVDDETTTDECTRRPAPSGAVLPEMVLPVIVLAPVDVRKMPPPYCVARLPHTLLRTSAREPDCTWIPPPAST